MSDEPTGRSIEELIEASSLGTPEAKAARESVPAELGFALALVATHHPGYPSGCRCGHWSYPGHMARLVADALTDARREGAAEALEQAADVGPSSTATDQLWRKWLRDRAVAIRDTP